MSTSTYRLGAKEKGLKDGLRRSRSGDRLQYWILSGGLNMQRSFSQAIGSLVGGGILCSRRVVAWMDWFGSILITMNA